MIYPISSKSISQATLGQQVQGQFMQTPTQHFRPEKKKAFH